MSNDDIVGRLCALEIFSMTALGLYLANSRNDPDYAKATALLEHLRNSISLLASPLPAAAKAAAEAYGNHLLETLAQNLRTMRGEDGQSH